MEGAVVGVAVKAYDEGTKFAGYIKGKNDYVNDLEGNYLKLKTVVGTLKARREDVEAEVNRDKRLQATRECQDWIRRVKEIETELSKLEKEYNRKVKPSWKPNRWFSKSKLSERIAKKSAEVYCLLAEGIFERVVTAKSVKPVEKMGALNIEDKQSLHTVFQKTLSYLKHDKIRRIGIWGALGIGKTAIMRYLNDNEGIAKMFEIIIWITMPGDPSDTQKLQEDIIQRLKLSVEGISRIEEKAQRISEGLEGKKCLILLDEVGHKIDLHEIMGFRTLQKDSKVVLASRSRGICRDMDADALIEVKNLSFDDAWNMFQEILGDASSSKIKNIAEQVVQECGGFPLLIDRVARTFKSYEENVELWHRGLNYLHRWDGVKVGGIDEVLECLKLCCQDLDETKMGCFLYSALYPEQYEICVDYLLECWRAEGFMGHTNEFKVARGEGHAILKELIDLSLLEITEGRKFVKMNKVLRKMALKMSLQRNDFKLLVKPREGLNDFPKKEEWEQATRISLMDNQLENLPDTDLGFHNLLTLFLQRNRQLKKIPDSFFATMQSLRVLDLHATEIQSLPSSLSKSIHLRGLYLNSCSLLREFKFDKKALVDLEALDIRGTKISLLQIGGLEKVRCLKMSLSNFGMDSHIEGKLSSFNSLEELSIEVCSFKLWWDKIVDTVKKEVAALEKLTSLRFCFREEDCLELFVTTSPIWKKNSCMTFQFAKGNPDSTFPQILESICYASNNNLKLVNSNGVNPIMLKLPMETCAFRLINPKGASRLSDFGIENMDKMLVCLIEGCNEIKTIINGNGITQGVLKRLEHLCINNVQKLESIWKGPVCAGSLPQLKNLTLSKCPGLKKIFSDGMIQLFCQLEYLRVEECHLIEEIIIAESEYKRLEASGLPSLKTLILLDLPKLTSICVDYSLEWPSLQRIKISGCDMLRRLPFNNANATKLRFIEGQEPWWGALIWDDDAVKKKLQSLCILN